jgi:hypothetical protein
MSDIVFLIKHRSHRRSTSLTHARHTVRDASLAPRPSVLVPPYYSQQTFRAQQSLMRLPPTRWIIQTYLKLTALLVILAGAIRLLDR